MAPQDSGYTTPGEVDPPVHPTAARRPHTLVVQSENASYSDEFITSKYHNRGADVHVVNGQYVVNPTVQSFEFQTQRKVSKTGYVFFLTDILFYQDDLDS